MQLNILNKKFKTFGENESKSYNTFFEVELFGYSYETSNNLFDRQIFINR